MDVIRIRGARTHNLQGIDLDLPRDRLVVITGLSGSGKSSLAFDTIYAEGQRRYVESLSAYARQFLSVMEKPDVDHIEGLSPAISIEQKATSHNPRSTVGTVTEVYDYLRVLFARAGVPRCPEHGQELAAQSVSQMVDQVLALPEGTAVLLLAPVVQDRKGEHAEAFEHLRAQGFVRAFVDGKLVELDAPPAARAAAAALGGRRGGPAARAPRRRAAPRGIVRDGARRCRRAWRASCSRTSRARAPLVFSNRYACTICGYSLAGLEPRLFSFNNPSGACGTCGGLGVQEYFDPARVVVNPALSLAGGAVRGWDRRNAYYFQLIQALARHYRFDIETPWGDLPEAVRHVLLYGSGEERVEFRYFDARGGSAKRSHPWEGILPNLERRYRETESATVREELAKYRGTRRLRRLRRQPAQPRGAPRVRRRPHAAAGRRAADRRGAALLQLRSRSRAGAARSRAAWCARSPTASPSWWTSGLDYLSLDRSAETLSGGEAQRIRLASQIGSGLVGVMYILDEPSIGLHQRDNQRLLDTLTRLRDLGNTVLVVEHDEDAIRQADHVVDLGPGAGIHGGRVVAQGTPAEIEAAPDSLTGQYLSGRRRIPVPPVRTPGAARPGAAHRRRHGQQPARRDRGDPARPAHLRHRRLGLGQVDAGGRHAVPPRRGRTAGVGGRRGAVPRGRGTRAGRSRHRHRPEPDRPHAALQPRDLHRAVRPDPRAVRRGAGGARPRLRPGPLQLQRARRPLRVLRGRRRHQGGDALPARRLRHLRRVPRHALQPRDARDPLQGPQHPRGAGDDRRGRGGVLPQRARRCSRSSRRCSTWGSPTCASARTPRRSPAARRSASSSPASSPSAPPAARCTSSTSPPRACISTTSSNCSPCCCGCATRATPSSSSSTTST